MQSTARPEGDGWILNGSKTFITNGPYADTTVFICKEATAGDSSKRDIMTFLVLTGACPDSSSHLRCERWGLIHPQPAISS